MAVNYNGRPLTAARIFGAMAMRVRRASIRLIPTAATKTAYGPRMVKRGKDATFMASALGSYGRFISDKIEAVERPFVFLDIGANAGLFSLVASGKPNCSNVIAVEPVPSNYGALVRNIGINNAYKITPVCGAVSTTDEGFVTLSFDPDHSGASRIVGSGTPSGREAYAVVISPRHLARLLESTSDQIILKVDVEGNEADVLTTIERAGIFPRITEAVIELSTKTGGGLQNVSSVRGIMRRNGFVETTSAPTTSVFHYDAHYTRQ